MTQCGKIIVGFMANVGNVFYPTFTNVFFIFPTFFTFFFKFSSQRLLHLLTQTHSRGSLRFERPKMGAVGRQWG